MGEIGRLCVQRAKDQPESVFAMPKDVIGEVMLTRGEKLAALKRWRLRILDHRQGSSILARTRDEQDRILDEIEEAKKLLEPERQNDGTHELEIGED
jgi:hypothetical protein